jgi:hypothetical protein
MCKSRTKQSRTVSSRYGKNTFTGERLTVKIVIWGGWLLQGGQTLECGRVLLWLCIYADVGKNYRTIRHGLCWDLAALAGCFFLFCSSPNPGLIIFTSETTPKIILRQILSPVTPLPTQLDAVTTQSIKHVCRYLHPRLRGS